MRDLICVYNCLHGIISKPRVIIIQNINLYICLSVSITILLQVVMGLLDHGTLPGQGNESFLHLSQLAQVAVLCPAL